MGLITEEFEIGLSAKNIIHLNNLGYILPKYKDDRGRIRVKRGTKILIPVKDIPFGSNIKVDIKCDNCGKLNNMYWQRFIKQQRDDGNIYCNSCACRLYRSENMRLTNLRNGVSFYRWCIDNNRQDILDRWDYELNDYKPDEIGYGTNMMMYFKCPDNIHNSEIKYVGAFTNGQEGSMSCFQCSSLGFNYPIGNILWSDINKKTSFEYSYGSEQPVYWKCENGKHEDYERKIEGAVNLKFRCPVCARERNESYLQEKVRKYLTKFVNEFGWKLNHEKNCLLFCRNIKNNYRLLYDNELISDYFKLIIEVNGIQHYKITHFHFLSARSNNTTPEYELQYQIERDEYKMNFALDNGYYYLAIPYTADDNNETYKTMIDDMLNYIYENIQQEN